MSILDPIKNWLREKKIPMNYSDPTANFGVPKWRKQTLEDLKRHEGFRKYAYPDPLSRLYRKYPKAPWGFDRGDALLALYGESEASGRPWTVGYGFTHGVTPRTIITKEQAARKLEQELTEHLTVLDKLIPSWKTMPDYVKTVLANMAYNMGYDTLKDFRPTLSVFEAGDYPRAGRRLRNTLWYKQVGYRAEELIRRLETGEIEKQHRV